MLSKCEWYALVDPKRLKHGVAIEKSAVEDTNLRVQGINDFSPNKYFSVTLLHVSIVLLSASRSMDPLHFLND